MKLKSAAKWLVILPVAAVLATPMLWTEILIAEFIGGKAIMFLLFAPGKWIDESLVRIHLISDHPTGGHFPDLRFYSSIQFR